MRSMKKKILRKFIKLQIVCVQTLQIINHIQDCKKDFKELNRVYIPESFFKKYSLNNSILSKNKSIKNFARLKIEIIDNVLASLKITKVGLNKIQSWRLRKKH